MVCEVFNRSRNCFYEKKEEVVIRLPPVELAISAGSLGGCVTVCLLGIHGGFSRGRNILGVCNFQNFLGPLDFISRITMHGEENSTLLQAALVALGFEFGDTHANQCTGESADRAADIQPCHTGHDWACSDEWAQARDCQQPDTCQHAESATNYATGGHACCCALWRFCSLLCSHILGSAQALRQKHGNI